MAITPLKSPGTLVRLDDRTGTIVVSETSTGGFIGNFRWGPVNQVTSVYSEADLVRNFAAPDTSNTVDFHTAKSFLDYSQNLKLIRAIRNALNATAGGTASTVLNRESYDSQTFAFASVGAFMAKYPGALGNSLKVSTFSFITDVSTTSTNFNNWTYASSFDSPAGTSEKATTFSSSNDEIHIAVIDEKGLFTGTPGTVLEVFPYLSLAQGTKDISGLSLYYVDVLNARSKYIWAGGIDSTVFPNAGRNVNEGVDFTTTETTGVTDYQMTNGADSDALTATEHANALDLFNQSHTSDVSIFIGPEYTGSAAITIANNIVSVLESREDMYALLSFRPEDTDTDARTTFADALSASKYYELNSGRLRIFDRYNDKYINVPDSGKLAGSMARNDVDRGIHHPHAGQDKSQIFGVSELYYNPNQTQRDTLYRKGINPVVSVPGKGIFKMGDKTRIGRPSIFSQQHAVRLSIFLRKIFKEAGDSVIFKFNDEFTRAEFVSLVEPSLRRLEGDRGIANYTIQCDENNNTADVRNAQEFVADVYIEFPNSINYVTVNLIATRAGATITIEEGARA